MIKAKLGDKEIKSNAEATMITNQKGSYFINSEKKYSKYQGFMFNCGMELYKTLDNIEIEDETKEVVYEKDCIKVEYKKSKQEFKISREEDVVMYECDTEKESNFNFDCREAYDMSKWGRYYEVNLIEGVILVKYTKVADEREKSNKDYTIYTAIAADNVKFKLKGEWKEYDYEFDSNRLDESRRYIYGAFSLKCKKAAISSSLDKDEAIKNAKSVFEKIKNKLKKDKSDKKIGFGENIAYELSLNALNSLKVRKEKNIGIYAGLPWFFQFWTRDSALSAKSLYKIDKGFAKEILLRFIDNIREDGLIPNRMPSSGLDSIDGTGIVFLRIREMQEEFSDNEMNYIFKELKKSIGGIMKFHSNDLLVENNSLESWMDTENREGKRIEVQALLLMMLKFLRELAERFGDEAQLKKAEKEEALIKKKVKELFYHEGILYDGVNDKTIRPNVFLAYYYYPELLKENEWEKTFDNALKGLWLEWGGLSSIDIRDVRYCAQHTGMNNRSYHNGDSWFYLNNIASICMQRVNKIKYRKFIEKIIEASTFEITQKGIFGFHAELSSASKIESNGCLAQAWSSALYIEMIDEINKKEEKCIQTTKIAI